MDMVLIMRRGSVECWVVLVEDRLYGEYLDKEEAILDSIDAAHEARATGTEAEVWDAALRLY
jgi:hypothetical protein